MNTMRSFFRTTFSLTPYANSFQQWQAAAVYLSAVGLVLTRLVLLWPDALDEAANQANWDPTLFGLANALALAGALLVVALTRRGDLMPAGVLLVALLLAEGAVYALGDDWAAARALVALWAGVALASLLFHWREGATVAALAVILLAAGALLDIGDLATNAQNDRAVVLLAMVAWMLVLASVAHLVKWGGERALTANLARDPAQDLITVGDVLARGVFERQDMNTFLWRVMESVRQRFEPVYHAQIYLIEEGSPHAVLRASTGAIGEQLLAEEHRLDIGGLSTVGRVTRSGKPLLLPDISRDEIYRLPPLLPDSRSQLTLPLLADEDVIGALDLHSQQINGFDDTAVTTLTALARQIALAVDSLRLYESAQRSMRENQALHQQTQASLREIERLNYQLTGRAWTEYLRLQSDSATIAVDLESGQVTSEVEWTDLLEEAASQQRVVSKPVDGRRLVALPIIVRNEVVGAMEFELGSSDELPVGAEDLITAVGQRLGLAMENRRLFDETQRVAQREALINDIGTDLQSATGVDAIIQRAAQHLQEALSAQQVTIRLGALPEGRGKKARGKAGA